MRININVKILLVFVSLLWGFTAFLAQALHGYLFSLIPCFGLGMILWYGFRGLGWMFRAEAQNPGSLRKLMNVIGNLGRLFRDMNAKNPDKHERLIELLALEPEAFKARAGITTPD